MTDKKTPLEIANKVLKKFPMFFNKEVYELTENEKKQLKEFILKQEDNN